MRDTPRPLHECGRIHIVGIGGCATRGLARLLAARGHQVTGSDHHESAAVRELREAGIPVHVPGAPQVLDTPVDRLIHSAAVPEDDPERVRARQHGVPTSKYAEALGELVARHRGIAVAGTHGKTSTAGMLASVWLAAGLDPSVLIGGHHPELAGNWRAGAGRSFITEACEFDRSFHYLAPTVAVITNLEFDHPDIYAGEEEVLEAFQVFTTRLPRGSLLVASADSRLLARLAVPDGVRHVTFGLGHAGDWRARPLSTGSETRFEVRVRGRGWGEVRLGVPGRHSIANALAATVVAAELGLPTAAIRAGLRRFPGIDRRFQRRGRIGGVDLIDDYAHHPTELETTLDTAREVFPGRPLWAVFQPHQYARLEAFGEHFARALARADRVLLLPAYSVREAQRSDCDALDRQLVEALRSRGIPVCTGASLDEGVEILSAELRRGDVCLSIGAGDVFRLTPRLERHLAAREESS